ncbi:hypothetical protein TRFO_16259 [Tritrichomonas foetus]|uniref:Condensation domain-containing protein n=1 Tax=Tritrichomonas foetus TaxID=1144522 RepID=A0A1J4KQY4_9EUKA|nr:hypothetical protein TRFO_16259 [Tritrichomonas foetus]|eukprot:OHT13506.1 hypothetical protein TRFO_16259 [Tritrichomonas foetus]
MISRPVSNYERFFLDTNCMVQIAFKISDPKYIPSLVDDFITKIDGFYIKSDGQNLILHNTKPDVHKIPSSISSLPDAAEWIFQNHTPPIDKALASIAVNDEMVILSINHLCCDGKYISRIISHIGKEEEEIKHKLPTTAFELFEEKLKNYTKDDRQAYHDPNVTRLYSKRPDLIDPDDGISRKLFFRIPIHELKNYDHERKVMNGLSENLWMSMILVASAYNNKLEKIGCSSTIDLRQFLPKGRDNWSVSNIFSNFPVYGRHPSTFNPYDISIREIEKDLRNSLNEGIKNEEYLAHLKASLEKKRYAPLPGMGVETSNSGMNLIRRPIIDIFGTLNVKFKGAPGHITLINSSCKSEENNLLGCQRLYRRNELGDKEATIIQKSIVFYLKNISRNETIGHALDQIQEFQESLK